MRSEIESLVARIKASFPGVVTEVEHFPSGAAMLDVRWLGRLFVLAYSPSGGFGVDEVKDDEGMEMGYRFRSADYAEAVEELFRLLRLAR
jgi:hypothetical protein